MKSTDVKKIYDSNYFNNQVDGYKEFIEFDARFDSLFERYKKNIKLLDLKPEHSLLEFGCGRGEIILFHANNEGKIAVGIDYASDAIEMAKEKANTLGISCAHFINDSFDTEKIHEYGVFDRIYASEFIEHISQQEGELFFKIAYEKLSKGGKLLVFTHPNTLQRRYGYKLMHFASKLTKNKLPKIQDDTLSEHYKMYHLNEQNIITIKKLATQANFKEIKVGYDSLDYKKNSIIGNALRFLIKSSFLKHIFQTNLYLIATKH